MKSSMRSKTSVLRGMGVHTFCNYVDVHVFWGVGLHTLCNYLGFNVFVGSNGVHTVYNPFGFGGCIFDFTLKHERNH